MDEMDRILVALVNAGIDWITARAIVEFLENSGMGDATPQALINADLGLDRIEDARAAWWSGSIPENFRRILDATQEGDGDIAVARSGMDLMDTMRRAGWGLDHLALVASYHAGQDFVTVAKAIEMVGGDLPRGGRMVMNAFLEHVWR